MNNNQEKEQISSKLCSKNRQNVDNTEDRYIDQKERIEAKGTFKKLKVVEYPEKRNAIEEGDTNSENNFFYEPYNLLLDSEDGAAAATTMSSHWSIPWSDLMTIMFIFLAIMLSVEMNKHDIKKVLQPDLSFDVLNKPGDVSVQSIYEGSKEIIRNASIENVGVVLQDDQMVKISIRGPMLFDIGKAEIKPDSKVFLDKIAEMIRWTDYKIKVLGHTDDFPINNEQFPTNWELSAIRATTVARYLIESGGIEPHRFTVQAHAKYRPILPNSSYENKELNRRVEIIINKGE